MKQRSIDGISLSTTRIVTRSSNGGEEKVGTGFFYSRKDKLYLVSNWHVLSGRDPTNPAFSETGFVASQAELSFMRKAGADLVFHNQVASHRFALTDDNGGSFKWLQHRRWGRHADVAILPIDLPSNVAYRALNEQQFFDRLILEIGDPIFVIGFPWGLAGSANQVLPIWKGGYVSSIPGLDYGHLPNFLIDSRTFKGMSGSPVVARVSLNLAINKIQDFNRESDPIAGVVSYFCGVYSGRLKVAGRNGPAIETDLGLVWRPELIDQIIDEGVPGSLSS